MQSSNTATSAAGTTGFGSGGAAGGQGQDRKVEVRWYDARARTALKKVALWTNVPWTKMATFECLAAEQAQVRSYKQDIADNSHQQLVQCHPRLLEGTSGMTCNTAGCTTAAIATIIIPYEALCTAASRSEGGAAGSAGPLGQEPQDWGGCCGWGHPPCGHRCTLAVLCHAVLFCPASSCWLTSQKAYLGQ